MVDAKRDYYEMLGIAKDADQKEIKSAFRKLALKFHPDRNKAPEAGEQFKEIAEAYAILSDPEKRKKYDLRGFSGVEDISTQDLFSHINFDDIFRGFGFDFNFDFGNSRHGGLFNNIFNHQKTTTAGRDIDIQVTVDLNTIYTGGEKMIELTYPINCDSCNGTGVEKGYKPRKCDSCNGTGQKVISSKGTRDNSNVILKRISICQSCSGKGSIIDNPCIKCHGSGATEKKEKLTIKIPKGIEDGMTLRISGHGYPGLSRDSKRGNLYVTIRTKPDSRFTRVGADLWRIETIDVTDAILGTEINIPTLNKNISLVIPSGTQHEEVLRIKGKGLPYFESKKFGDLKIRIKISMPQRLSRNERKLYEQLRELKNKSKYDKHWF